MKYLRYFIQLSYKGTNFHGWQYQVNAPTIQAVLEKSLSLILQEQIETTGAGRTDTGVHAKYFMAHFDSSGELNLPEILYKLNRILPDDIAIQQIYKAKPAAHSRFDALSRTYEYHLHFRKDPFVNEYSLYIHEQLNINLMNQAAEKLLIYDDFTSFSKLHSNNKTNICNIIRAFWTYSEVEQKAVFTIEADRFLRNMVRAVVGTLIDTGRGKISPENFTKIIESKDRSKASSSAPSQGLFLVSVKYPDNIFV